MTTKKEAKDVLKAAAAHARNDAARSSSWARQAREGIASGKNRERHEKSLAVQEEWIEKHTAAAESAEIALRAIDLALPEGPVRAAVRRLVADLRLNWNMDDRSGEVAALLHGARRAAGMSKGDRERARLRDAGAAWLRETASPHHEHPKACCGDCYIVVSEYQGRDCSSRRCPGHGEVYFSHLRPEHPMAVTP